MNELVLAGLLGGVGGLTRGVVGLFESIGFEMSKIANFTANINDFRACSKIPLCICKLEFLTSK